MIYLQIHRFITGDVPRALMILLVVAFVSCSYESKNANNKAHKLENKRIINLDIPGSDDYQDPTLYQNDDDDDDLDIPPNNGANTEVFKSNWQKKKEDDEKKKKESEKFTFDNLKKKLKDSKLGKTLSSFFPIFA